MATRSKVYVGRYDETLDELRDVVKSTAKGTDAHTLNRFALAFLEQVDTPKPGDTVHVSANSSDDGVGGRTFTVTFSHTPEPPKPVKKPAPAPEPAPGA